MISSSTVGNCKTTDKEEIEKGIYKEVIEISENNYKTVISGKGAITKKYVSAIGNLVIEEGITEIGSLVFGVSKSVQSVKLPESLKKIGDGAFEELSAREITIPRGVESIGKNIFLKAVRLQKIVNNSSAAVDVPRSGTDLIVGYNYFVDGKQVSQVLPGKTMTSTPRKFKLTLKKNGGKIVGKEPNEYTYDQQMRLPEAKKKGYKFIGWTFGDKTSIGNMNLWQRSTYNECRGASESRYAQFAKVKYKAKKKSFEVKCTNFNSGVFIVGYSTKKDRSDEVEYKVYAYEKKLYTYDPLKKNHPKMYLKGKEKTYKGKGYKKNWIKVTIPKLKSNKKYYVRIKHLSYTGENGDVDQIESRWFGRKTIKIK